ncbi:Protein of unknown function [Pseudomonas delhiensis]|nr:DUF3540 domain-containing protein [Pseudomonas delhiensis]SNS90529.1 Protein of unknown function [Pseudomonas delhiensis]
MINVEHAAAMPAPSLGLLQGSVVDCLADGSFMVQAQGRGWHCQRSASCLLAPEEGDSVLLALAERRYWMLAVLERARAQTPSRLSVAGDLSICAPGGALRLDAGQRLAMAAPAFALEADTGECRVQALRYSGDELSAWVGAARWVGGTCETLWRTLSQVSQSLFRQVGGVEHVRAGHLDYQADDSLRLHARNTLITSQDLAKLDAQQIHVG